MQHNNSQQTAMKYETIVREDGRIELVVPFTPGAQVVVFVIADATDSFTDLVAAAEHSLDFWDNSFDDEDWNNA